MGMWWHIPYVTQDIFEQFLQIYLDNCRHNKISFLCFSNQRYRYENDTRKHQQNFIHIWFPIHWNFIIVLHFFLGNTHWNVFREDYCLLNISYLTQIDQIMYIQMHVSLIWYSLQTMWKYWYFCHAIRCSLYLLVFLRSSILKII